MNYCDAYVTEVLEGAFEKYGKWWKTVKYISEGGEGETKLMFDTLKEAEEVKKDYKFLV